ncbi:unnamed protein product [Ectocarpus fasciculatus]
MAKRQPKQPKQPKVWCDLSQIEARRLILKVALGRDIGPDDVATIKNPNRLCETLTKMLACSCIRGWTVTKFLSAGAYGHVFRAVHTNGTSAAIKVQTGDAKRLRDEVRSQKAFHKRGLAPKIIRYCSFKPKNRLGMVAHERLNRAVQDKSVTFQTEDESPTGNLVHVIIMEEIAGVLGQWLRREKSNQQLHKTASEIIKLMLAFRTHRLTHGDLHLNNIGYVYTDASKRYMRLMPIDFGRSYVGRAFTSLEVGSLVRTLAPSFRGGLHPENRGPLARYIKSLAWSSALNFRVDSFATVQEKFTSQMRAYLVKYIR